MKLAHTMAAMMLLGSTNVGAVDMTLCADRIGKRRGYY